MRVVSAGLCAALAQRAGQVRNSEFAILSARRRKQLLDKLWRGHSLVRALCNVIPCRAAISTRWDEGEIKWEKRTGERTIVLNAIVQREVSEVERARCVIFF